MQRRIMFAAGTAVVALSLGYALIGPMLTSIMAAFGLSNAWGGLTSSFLTIGFVAAALGGGFMADWLGMRTVMLAGCVLLAVGSLLCGVAAVYWTFLLGLVLFGIGAGTLESVASALVNAVFLEKSAPAMNLLQALFGLGALTGPVLAAAVLRLDSGSHWRLGFLVCAGVALIALVIQGLLPARVGKADLLDFALVKAMVLDKPFMILCLALFFYVGAEAGMSAWAAAFMERVHDWPKAKSAFITSLFWAGLLVGRLLYAKLTQHYKPTTLVKIATLVSIGLVVAALLVPSSAWCFALFGLVGLAFAGIWPTLIALGGQWHPRYSATGTGVMVALGALGAIAVPYIIGALTDYFGHLRPAMGFNLPLLALLAILVYWLTAKAEARARAAEFAANQAPVTVE